MTDLNSLARTLAERLERELYARCGFATSENLAESVFEPVIREAIDKTQPQWISVEERLPETRDNVYVITQHGASIGWRDFCEVPNWTLLYDPHTEKMESTLDAHLCNRSVITHWMPIPKTPAIRSLKQSNSGRAEQGIVKGVK